MDTPSAVALIPARAGSKRMPGKNIRPLAGHPLLAYTIAAARSSGVFGAIVVSTDSEETAAIARHYGAEIPFMRPAAMATDLSPDIEWVADALERLAGLGRAYAAFGLLRPTSPFRGAETISRAWQRFLTAPGADSLRAVERCRQHPGKMWKVEGDRIRPLLPSESTGPPAHSRPYQSLPPVYVQNASLELAWTRTVLEGRTIAGEEIVPFFTEDSEGFDVNEPRDWWYAEHLLETGGATLPAVTAQPWPGATAGAR